MLFDTVKYALSLNQYYTHTYIYITQVHGMCIYIIYTCVYMCVHIYAHMHTYAQLSHTIGVNSRIGTLLPILIYIKTTETLTYV